MVIKNNYKGKIIIHRLKSCIVQKLHNTNVRIERLPRSEESSFKVRAQPTE